MGEQQRMIDQIDSLMRQNKDARFCASQLADHFHISRSSASSYLNELCKSGKAWKIPGKPVYYQAGGQKAKEEANIFFQTYGRDSIYLKEIELAMASVHYPGQGLAMLIGGETGVGKTFFARLTYEYALSKGVIEKGSPFISFNCADYSHNPQLVSSILFGHVKGAFTGAGADRRGLVAEGEKGYLFLDEAHRLPPEAQEMLFSIMDTGTYRRMGEAQGQCKANLRLIFATTENLEETFLKTFLRRIPVVIRLPSFKEFKPLQRLNVIERLLSEEAAILGQPVFIHNGVVQILLKYPCQGNIGQLKNDIKIITARAYMRQVLQGREGVGQPGDGGPAAPECQVFIGVDDVSPDMRQELLKIYRRGYRINQIDDYIRIDSGPGKSGGKMQDSLYQLIDEEYDLQVLKDTAPEKIREILSGMIHGHFGQEKDFGKNFKEGFREDIQKEEGAPGWESGKLIDTLLNTFGTIKDATSIHITGQLSSELSILLVDFIEQRITQPEDGLGQGMEDGLLEKTAGAISSQWMGEYPGKPGGRGLVLELYRVLLRNHNKNQSGIQILVLAKGKDCARSVAEEVNRIFGSSQVQWYEYQDEIGREENLGAVVSMVKRLASRKGALVLWDGVFWEVDKEELARRVPEIPLRFLNAVAMTVAVEAVKLANQASITLDGLHSRLSRSLAMGRLGLKEPQILDQNTRILLTVCLTGYGSSEKISNMILNRFHFHNHMKLLPLDFDSLEELSARMREGSLRQDVVCVVGTHQPLEKEIPFVSIDDLLFGDGMARLKDLLMAYGVYANEAACLSEDAGSPSGLLQGIVDHFVQYLNSQRLYAHASQVVWLLEEEFGLALKKPQYVTLLVHVCCLVERALFLSPVYSAWAPALPLDVWARLERCFREVEEVYQVKIHKVELHTIYGIIMDFSQEG